MKSLIASVVLLVVSSFIFVGCSAKKMPADMPPVYPVTVTVLMNGQPQEGAVVHFSPKDESKWVAIGTTGSDGTTSLKTLNQYPGAILGEHTVIILKGMPDPKWVKKGDEDSAKIISVYNAKFSNPKISPLRYHVNEGKNTVTFEVEPAK